MRYCPKCGEEYRDEIVACAEDGSTLVDRQTFEATVAARKPKDIARLTAVDTLEDRFEADELAIDLIDAGFDASVVSNKPPTMGSLVDPAPPLYFIVVPEEEAARAVTFVREWQAELEATRPIAEEAAEAEEAATEVH